MGLGVEEETEGHSRTAVRKSAFRSVNLLRVSVWFFFVDAYSLYAKMIYTVQTSGELK